MQLGGNGSQRHTYFSSPDWTNQYKTIVDASMNVSEMNRSTRIDPKRQPRPSPASDRAQGYDIIGRCLGGEDAIVLLFFFDLPFLCC